MQGRKGRDARGLSDAGDRATRALQAAFHLQNGGLQVRFLHARDALGGSRELLAENPTPDRDAIREALAGNFLPLARDMDRSSTRFEEAAKELVR